MSLTDYLKTQSRTLYGRAEVFFGPTVDFLTASMVRPNPGDNDFFFSNAALIDGIYEADHRIATCEPNLFKLDAKTAVYGGVSNYGCISEQMSNSVGVFSNPVVIKTKVEYGDGSEDQWPLAIFFDRVDGSHAVDFDIEWDSSPWSYSETPVMKKEVRGHDSDVYILDQNNNGQYKAGVIITIYKWSKPFMRARVSEVASVIYENYFDEVLAYSIENRTDITLRKLPSSSGMLILDNTLSSFNPMLTSGIGEYAVAGTLVKLYLGYIDSGVISYELISTFFLKRWNAVSHEAHLEFQDVIQLIEEADVAIGNLDAEIG